MGLTYERWLETNIREQKQTGYAMVTVKVPRVTLPAHKCTAWLMLRARRATGFCV